MITQFVVSTGMSQSERFDFKCVPWWPVGQHKTYFFPGSTCGLHKLLFHNTIWYHFDSIWPDVSKNRSGHCFFLFFSSVCPRSTGQEHSRAPPQPPGGPGGLGPAVRCAAVGRRRGQQGGDLRCRGKLRRGREGGGCWHRRPESHFFF